MRYTRQDLFLLTVNELWYVGIIADHDRLNALIDKYDEHGVQPTPMWLCEKYVQLKCEVQP